MMIPYPNLDGSKSRFVRVRPHNPRRRDGKLVKYEQPPGVPPRAYFPAGSVEALRTGSGDVCITEGEKKALALGQSGLTSVGLGGVNCWNKKGTTDLIADLAAVPWAGRTVYIVFDSDPKPETRHNVRMAGRKLAESLAKAGAKEVLWVELPPAEGGGKQGVDDFLVSHGQVAFGRLVGLAAGFGSEGATASASSQSSQTVATELLGIAAEPEVLLWHAPDGETAYATRRSGGKVEHLPVKGKAFRTWLAHECYRRQGKVPGTQTMQDVLSVLEGKAKFDGPTHPVGGRVGGHGGKMYLDLADESLRVVEVDADGWRVLSDSPVRFRRSKGTLGLPLPQEGGTIDELRRFVNVSDAQCPLLLGWLVGALRPTGPYPLLKFVAEQGSGKTTAMRVLKSLFDPNVAPVRSAPKGERDLMIAAQNGWLLAYDNLSYMPQEMSDVFCRLATGGAMTTRTLYSDDDETIFQAQRPAIINSIEDVGYRSDLMDRAVVIELPQIDPKDRRPEDEFWADFEEARPRILGALLDAVSAAIRNLPTVRAAGGEWPRMADFAMWAVAAEGALGLEAGSFLAAYADNRATANQTALESSPVVTAILALIERRPAGFDGTATELLDRLKTGADTRQKGWPANARALSGQLDRLAPNLRAAGVSVERNRVDNNKLWRIARTRDAKPAPSASSQSSQNFGTVLRPCPDPTDRRCRPGDTLASFLNRCSNLSPKK